MSFIPLLNLVKAERAFITDTLINDSPLLIGVSLSLGTKYSLEVQVGYEIRSRQSLSSVDELRKYLNVVFGNTLDEEALSQETGIFDYIDTSQARKRSITKKTFLPLSCSHAKAIVSTDSARLKNHEFHLGSSQSLDVFIVPNRHYVLSSKNIIINLHEYDYNLGLLIKSFETRYKYQFDRENRLKIISRAKSQLHPALFGALKFAIKHKRFPRKSGRNRTDEADIWEFVRHEYVDSPHTANAVIYEGAIIRQEDIWKQYNETYSKYLIAGICS